MSYAHILVCLMAAMHTISAWSAVLANCWEHEYSSHLMWEAFGASVSVLETEEKDLECLMYYVYAWDDLCSVSSMLHWASLCVCVRMCVCKRIKNIYISIAFCNSDGPCFRTHILPNLHDFVGICMCTHTAFKHIFVCVQACVCMCGLTPLSALHSASERDFPLHISPRFSSLQGICILACAQTQSSCAIHKMLVWGPTIRNNGLYCAVGSLNKASSSNILPIGFHQTSILCVRVRVCVCVCRSVYIRILLVRCQSR